MSSCQSEIIRQSIKLASLSCALALLALVASPSAKTEKLNVDSMSNSGSETLDIISARGFNGKLYLTTTHDGYIVALYHIINPLADPSKLNAHPVLLNHGLGGDSAQMISRSERARPRRPIPGQVSYLDDGGDDCLAFMLANNNHDVYLVDVRGSSLNNHGSSADLNLLEGQKFWNFSLDEQALIDLPAAIDFVLEHSGAPKLHYIGYSQSTFFGMALLSAKPEYQAKLASFTVMSPVVFVAHIRGAAMFSTLSSLGVPDWISGNFMPQPIIDSAGLFARKFCANKLTANTICQSFARAASGVGDSSDSTSYFSSLFKSTAIRAVKHYGQLFLQQRFGMYDFGPEGNVRQYGVARAPNYDLSRIKLPTIIMVRGQRDFLSTPEDQLHLIASLGARLYMDIVLPNYNHLDFLLAKTLLRDVNLPLARAYLTIEQQQQGGFRLRDSTRAGRHLRPVAQVNSHGRLHELVVRQKFATNLATGLAEAHKSMMTQMGAKGNQGGGERDLISSGVQKSLSLLQTFGHFSDSINQHVSTLADRMLGERL